MWQRIRLAVARLEGSYVKVGVFGTADRGTFGVVHLAAVHEFGLANLPERSFIRATMAARSDDIGKLTARLARGVVAGTVDPPRALGLLGAYAASEVKRFIVTGQVKPPTSARAVARKNRRAGKPPGAKATTLIDTGRLMNAIAWQVVHQ